MNGESSLFSSYKPCVGNFKIKIVDGSLSIVAGKGYIVLSHLLTIQDVCPKFVLQLIICQ